MQCASFETTSDDAFQRIYNRLAWLIIYPGSGLHCVAGGMGYTLPPQPDMEMFSSGGAYEELEF